MNLLSNKIINGLLLIILLSGISAAQNTKLRMSIKATSSDDKREIVLYASGGLEEFYEGYIVFPNFMDRIQGGMKEGSFNFLDFTGMGTIYESKKNREELTKNKFSGGDLEVFSNDFDADKVLSFRIMPEFDNEKDDTASLFIKYVVYDFDNNQTDYFNWNAKINLYNKLIRVPLNKEVQLVLMNDKLSGYQFTIELSKTNIQQDILKIENRKLFTAIKSKTNECKKIDKKLKLDLFFAKSLKLTNPILYNTILFSPKGETESNIVYVDVEKYEGVKFNSEQIVLRNNIYHVQANTPFKIYNNEKMDKYKKYETMPEIFNSTYNFYFVPIFLEDDSLVADLYISIEKINLEDGIARWSPINKRVKIKLIKDKTNNINTNRYNSSFMFRFPNENWSAFFSRGGEGYEIYGYSDYERFINEFINITISYEEVQK
ncbi:MAG: hypothetical protein L3J41_05760 [Melioribacteraceae bacterium]|nr:hypothetical protein [Melioribacteraceae bacterium]